MAPRAALSLGLAARPLTRSNEILRNGCWNARTNVVFFSAGDLGRRPFFPKCLFGNIDHALGLFGPVFQGELLRSSRRRRYYFLRVVYCLILLLMIGARYNGFYAQEAFLRISRGFVYISDFAEFAQDTFLVFVQLQLLTLLLLVPALVGGAIADEKQRKTLHYLMATRLSSGEIVFDKLWARLFHVGVFVLLGLPVLCLLNLMGGLSWEYVAVAYADTAALTLFAASLAI